MSVESKVAWSQTAALTIVREAVSNKNTIDTARIFELAAEPEDGHAVSNIIQVTATLATHLATLLSMAAGTEEGALSLVEQMLAVNESMVTDD